MPVIVMSVVRRWRVMSCVVLSCVVMSFVTVRVVVMLLMVMPLVIMLLIIMLFVVMLLIVMLLVVILLMRLVTMRVVIMRFLIVPLFGMLLPPVVFISLIAVIMGFECRPLTERQYAGARLLQQGQMARAAGKRFQRIGQPRGQQRADPDDQVRPAQSGDAAEARMAAGSVKRYMADLQNVIVSPC